MEFKEEEGSIGYAAMTVQLPSGERIPFIFTISNLVASGTLQGFHGHFPLLSYRAAASSDPKV